MDIMEKTKLGGSICMRRKDREVKDFDAIVRIIDRCSIVRIGLADGDFPYIVPLNFAYTAADGCICLYIHGAMAGRKFEMLTKNPFCSFEMDVDCGIRLIPEKRDVTTKYMSVMGRARAVLLEGEERQRAVDEILMARDERTRDFDYKREMVPHTAVFRLEVLEISGKSNMKGEADI